MIKFGKHRYWRSGPPLGRLKSLHLNGVGYLPKKATRVDSSFGCWAICIIWRGEGWYRYGHSHDRIRVQAPFYFSIWPGEVFDYGPDEDWDESFLMFSGPRCAEWEAYGWLRRTNEVYPLRESLEEIHRLHEELLRLTMTNEPANLDCAKSLLEQLLCRLNEHQLQRSGLQSHAEKIEALAKTWRENPAKLVHFEDAAEQAGMSYVTFRRKFLEIIGKTPYQYLVVQRIGYACRLLMNEELSIKEVSALSGFDYPQSFTRLFQQQMGQTPKQFRAAQYTRVRK